MKRFKKILAAVDTTHSPDKTSGDYPALRWAVALAIHNQSRLKIVDTVQEFPWVVRLGMSDHASVHEALVRDKTARIEALASSLREQGLKVETRLLEGPTSVAITREVLRSKHDLVVRVAKGVQSRRHGFIGTTGLRLLRKCPSPVWLVRPDRAPGFSRVLAAVDPAPQDDVHAELNRAIMELATSIAHYQEGECHVVHGWEIFGANLLRSRMEPVEYRELEATAQAKVAAAFEEFLAPYRKEVADGGIHLLQGDPGHAIPVLAEEKKMDLIVMGTIGRVGIPGLLMGNTAELVLERVLCPVLAIKPAGFTAFLTASESE